MRQAPREIATFIFTGFLEAGKTQFIQSTLEDKRFNSGEKTLLLVCEEGEVEYDLAGMDNVILRTIEKEELTEEKLDLLVKETRAERVIMEYNGMWLLDDFFQAMPEDWAVYQIMMIADSGTFAVYNSNMRQLVYDKLNMCSMVAFNRLDGNTDKTELHKIVRGANRRCDIVYEYKDGTTEPDTIEDPLPFDVNAPVVAVEDRDFALFFSDLMDNMKQYDGKTVRFKGVCAKNPKLPSGTFACGRHVMTCCVEDIQYCCLLVDKFIGADSIRNADWIILEARVDVKFSRVYGRKGPVLTALKVEKCEPLPNDQAVATFY